VAGGKSVERTAAFAVRVLSTILALPSLQILPMPSQVVAEWIHLLGRHAVEGAGVFDLQIIATMLANGVQLCTPRKQGYDDEEISVRKKRTPQL
jgi:hypothetical protein